MMAQALTRDGWPWAAPSLEGAAALQALAPLPWLVAEALHLPFDTMRSQHALAVQSGLIARSMLESRDFELSVDALEHAALGFFARHV
jgi:hypothetical protein